MDIYYPRESASRYNLLLDGKVMDQEDIIFAHIPTGLVVFIEKDWRTGERIVDTQCHTSRWRVESNGRLVDLSATGWYKFVESYGRIEIVPL